MSKDETIPFAVPVSMLSSHGKGGKLAAGVIGLLIMMALVSRRDPTIPRSDQRTRGFR